MDQDCLKILNFFKTEHSIQEAKEHELRVSTTYKLMPMLEALGLVNRIRYTIDSGGKKTAFYKTSVSNIQLRYSINLVRHTEQLL